MAERQPLRVLHVEDSDDDAHLVMRAVTKAGYDLTFTRVLTGPDMQAALRGAAWDVVISDYNLPQFSAPEALTTLQATGLDLPFIIVSGAIVEEQAVDMLRAGAHDFITKGNLARLGPAIERELREAAERHQRREAQAALQALEQRFRALIENSADAITLLGSAGQVIYDSPAAPRLLGYGPDEFIGRSAFDIVHPDDQPAMQARLGQLLQDPATPVRLQLRLKHADGGWRWIEGVASNLLAEPSVQAIVVNYRDITERRQAEEKVRRQFVYLAALREIDRAIMASIDLRLSLSLLLAHLTTQLDVAAATVLVYNPTTRLLELAAERGFRVRPLAWSKLRLGEGYAGRAALERRSLHLDDLTTQADNPGLAQTIAANGFVGYDAVPLIAKGEVRGVLEIFRRALPPEAASDDAQAEWQDFLQALSAQAAIAVDNATLFERLQRSNLELAQAYDENLEGWSRALDLRDQALEGHGRRVTDLTVRLAEALHLTSEELVHLRRGALLHDIGQMGIPDSLLLKPGPLTADEWAVMRRHPTLAFELLSPIEFLRPALDIPYCHHEKWDGTGYPRGLKEEQIPLAARVFTVIDVWDALRSARSYRPAWPAAQARAYIEAQAGRHFDPRVVVAFLRLIDEP